MAHVKAGATTKGNRDSKSKRLGVKKFGGELVVPGNIIIRQRGTKVHAGTGTKIGRDYTIFAIKKGVINFKKSMGKLFVKVMPN